MGVPGLPVHWAFVPSLLIGSLSGSFFGEILESVGTADPGVYSMCGAAAVLGGFNQMTLAIVVIDLRVSKGGRSRDVGEGEEGEVLSIPIYISAKH